MACLTKARRTVNMRAVYGFCRVLLLFAMVGSAGVVLAQDPPETTAPPDTGVQAPQSSIAPASNDSDLAAEVEQLRAEIDRLKRQINRLNSAVEELQFERAEATPVPARTTKPVAKKGKTPAPSATLAAVTPADPDERTPTTILVFHDGHRVEAQNYAIVGQSLWIYTQQDSKKVPLSDLDVTATKNANSDRGVVFQLPPTK